MSKAQQSFLRAIAIKLEVETHKKYRKVMNKVAWVAFIGFLGLGLANSIARYNNASDILSDAAYVNANVELLSENGPDEDSSYRYSFALDGNTYEQEFSASDASYEKFGDGEVVRVAYKESNPAQSEIAYRVDNNNSVGGIIKHFALLFFAGGIGFMVIYMFLTNGIVQPVEDYEDEEGEDEPRS